MVRDLLLPARELTFTLPQIAGSLEALGLELLAMNCPPAVLARFRAMFPSPAAEGDLACWDRFEAAYPGAFVGMYRFWCGPRA
jgi:hypothetical protein